MTTFVAPPLNILVAGIYWSGSGAVVDYLKGHPDCFTPRGEFTDFKRAGRIGSMLSARSRAQARRLAALMWLETALGKLPLALLKQARGKDPASLPLKEQVKHNRLKLQFLKQYRKHLRQGGAPQDPLIWHKWLQTLGQLYAGDRKGLVLNQPVWIGQHEQSWPGVFEPFKLLVVHRDPIDQFAEVVRQGKIGKRKSDPAFDDSEKDDIAYVLKGIAAKMESLIALNDQLPEDRLLCVGFEDFVHDANNAARVICHFLGLPHQPVDQTPFNPNYSIRNIGIGDTDDIRAMLAPYPELVDRLYRLRERF
ncbi:MAG: sulfotransferase [Marinobacter sp.]|nr:sulfotransferase [Marinobacter sp.]